MGNLNNLLGLPTEFKGIKIYPIKLIDADVFYENVQCLMYEKNKIPDKEIIKMSYLDFLFHLTRSDQNVYLKLLNVLKLILADQEFDFNLDSGKIILKVKDISLDGFDFESIKEICFKQNLIKVNEELFSDEVELALREAEEFVNQRSNFADLEEQIAAFHVSTGITYEKISKYTIYQFNKSIERLSIIKNFDTYAALLAQNGASEEIKHWLSHIEEKGKYANITMSKSEFQKITADAGITQKQI